MVHIIDGDYILLCRYIIIIYLGFSFFIAARIPRKVRKNYRNKNATTRMKLSEKHV